MCGGEEDGLNPGEKPSAVENGIRWIKQWVFSPDSQTAKLHVSNYMYSGDFLNESCVCNSNIKGAGQLDIIVHRPPSQGPSVRTKLWARD